CTSLTGSEISRRDARVHAQEKNCGPRAHNGRMLALLFQLESAEWSCANLHVSCVTEMMIDVWKFIYRPHLFKRAACRNVKFRLISAEATVHCGKDCEPLMVERWMFPRASKAAARWRQCERTCWRCFYSLKTAAYLPLICFTCRGRPRCPPQNPDESEGLSRIPACVDRAEALNPSVHTHLKPLSPASHPLIWRSGALEEDFINSVSHKTDSNIAKWTALRESPLIVPCLQYGRVCVCAVRLSWCSSPDSDDDDGASGGEVNILTALMSMLLGGGTFLSLTPKAAAAHPHVCRCLKIGSAYLL
ncbi:hypothetical protein IRJ41_020689, partial [Triplophysa rosa]